MVDNMTVYLCQQVFPDMILVPKSMVDLDLAVIPHTEKKLTLVMSNDNVAALVVLCALSDPGAIYLWKICTCKQCSCRPCKNQYQTLDLLGSGGYGSVFLVERLGSEVFRLEENSRSRDNGRR